jgi:hypothetical protein
MVMEGISKRCMPLPDYQLRRSAGSLSGQSHQIVLEVLRRSAPAASYSLLERIHTGVIASKNALSKYLSPSELQTSGGLLYGSIAHVVVLALSNRLQR